MSLWARFLGNYEFWKILTGLHQKVEESWDDAVKYFGSQNELETSGLSDKMSNYNEIIRNPGGLKVKNLADLEEQLKTLGENLLELQKSIDEVRTTKTKSIEKSLLQSDDYRAYCCLMSFKKKKGLSTRRYEQAKTYLEKQKEVDSLKDSAKEKGIKECGSERKGKRTWNLYKKLFKLVVDEGENINDILSAAEISREQLQMLGKTGLIKLKDVYELIGFETCLENDSDG